MVEAKQAEIVATDFALDDEVRILPTPGHTPRHYIVELSSRGQTGIMTGDLLHHPIQVVHPEWSPIFCAERVASRAQRIRCFDAWTDSNATLIAAHFGGPTAGRIVQTRAGRRFHLNDPDPAHA